MRDEYGFGGQYTIVKDYVGEHRRRRQEMFVPLPHQPGHTQCDFGEAVAVIVKGVEWRVTVQTWGVNCRKEVPRSAGAGEGGYVIYLGWITKLI